MRISDWSSDVCSSDLAKELAELTAMLLLTVSPRRILIGGGVGMGQSHLFPMIRAHCAELLAGYLPDLNASALEDIIKQPSLGTDAGPMGAVAIGLRAKATPLGRRRAEGRGGNRGC